MVVARSVFAYDGMGVVVHAPKEVVVYVHPVIAVVGCGYVEAAAGALLGMGELVCPKAGGPNVTLARVGSLDVLADAKRCILIAVDRSAQITELGEGNLSWIGYVVSMAPALECGPPTEVGECARLCSEVERFISEARLMLEILR